MRKTLLRSSASKLRLDVEAGVRTLSREVGLGVVEALQERPMGDQPGWRAEQLALGALHGIEEGLDQLQRSLAEAMETAIATALSAALTRAPQIEKISEDAARAFARGALGELRDQLGARGEGPLTRSLDASARRVVGSGAGALATPLVLLAVAAGFGLIGSLLLRRT